jgi:hypothetical protein
MRIRAAVLLFSVIAAAGCGSNSSTDPGNPVPCAMTLSGGVTGDFVCHAIGVWNAGLDRGGIDVVPDADASASVSGGIGFPGEPHTGTFTEGGTGANSLIELTSGPARWNVSAGSVAAGSYTLQLTTVSNPAANSQGKSYLVHGVLDATLVPEAGTGAAGNVTLHITF